MCIAAGLLPGAVRDLAGCDDRRGVARARHAGKIRPPAQDDGNQAMSIMIYVPRDSAALALGADAVAQAIRAEAVRAACCGWSRWSRCKPQKGASHTGR